MTNGPCALMAFHPVKPLLALASLDLCFWDLQSGNRLNLLADAPTNGVRCVAFSSDGKWIALGMENGEVSLWNFVTGRLSSSFREHSAALNILCFSSDGRWLASGGYDKRVVLYDVRQGGSTPLEGHKEQVCGLAFALDDKTLVSTSWDGTIRFWSVANHKVALVLTHDGGPVNSVAFSPDGNLMATAGADGTARLWPAAQFNEVTASRNSKENKK